MQLKFKSTAVQQRMWESQTCSFFAPSSIFRRSASVAAFALWGKFSGRSGCKKRGCWWTFLFLSERPLISSWWQMPEGWRMAGQKRAWGGGRGYTRDGKGESQPWLQPVREERGQESVKRGKDWCSRRQDRCTDLGSDVRDRDLLCILIHTVREACECGTIYIHPCQLFSPFSTHVPFLSLSSPSSLFLFCFIVCRFASLLRLLCLFNCSYWPVLIREGHRVSAYHRVRLINQSEIT